VVIRERGDDPVARVSASRDFIEVGRLLSYGIDIAEMRRLVDMTVEVLRGERPSEIPFYQQTKFELVLDRRTGTSLGLDFQANLVAVADEVIE
jgi:putative ABC transport system substrate-binding protein